MGWTQLIFGLVLLETVRFATCEPHFKPRLVISLTTTYDEHPVVFARRTRLRL